ncbi:arginase family domain-containing protein [Ditylenchus destructor]|nr:arginase family domain-containing protein [Ditylenchus destructor]
MSPWSSATIGWESEDGNGYQVDRCAAADRGRAIGMRDGPQRLSCCGALPMLLKNWGIGWSIPAMWTPAPLREFCHPNPAVHHLAETVAWTEALTEAAYRESAGAVPIFLGGDHAISAGTVAGMARRVAETGRPFFVLWLDAHTDYHTLETTRSGNLHGTPVAYFSGRHGFEGYFPPLSHAVPEDNIGMIGIRSVDPAERAALEESGITVHDMRSIDEHGVAVLLRQFLARVQAANGLLHVSLDVDFLEPSIAPAVGTTVPGGATLDLVELNPFLDERGRTATLMVDLAASLLGKRVMDRPTRAG